LGEETAASRPPAVQLNSIFSAKTDPRENPEKNPDLEFYAMELLDLTMNLLEYR
jgi:hypothetical protein